MPFKDREQQLAYWRSYGSKNAEKKAAYDREYRERNAETRRAQQAEWRASHTAHLRVARVEQYSRMKAQIIDGYGRRCACCGTTYRTHLTIDHVAGGGTRDRRERGLRTIYRQIIRDGFPDTYQLLCFNCNYAKHALGRCACSEGLAPVAAIP